MIGRYSRNYSSEKVQDSEDFAAKIKRVQSKKFALRSTSYTGKSLGCIPLHNAFRQQCINIIRSPHFETFVLVMITANCLALAVSDPTIPDNSGVNKHLSYAEYFFTTIFFLEMCIK
ncbi:hypothetical protein CYMTET_12631, partial [Cymbomonas tetramitiformis]